MVEAARRGFGIKMWLAPYGQIEQQALDGASALYAQAPALGEAGERVLSTDEMTGIQALERKHPTRLLEPGQEERREFEYIRRGTVTLIANFDVAQGTIVTPSLGPTRTEEDFLGTIASLPGFGMAPEGHFLYSSGPNM